MKGKAAVIQIITLIVAVIGAYGALFTTGVQQWLGALSFALTLLVQSPILSSGTWPKNWTWVIWATNITGIIIQVLGYFSDHALVPADVVNYLIIGINIGLTIFVKDYGTGSQIENTSTTKTA